MRLRGNIDTVTAGEMPSPVTLAGVIIRYGFYAIGMLVLGMIGLGLFSMWRMVPQPVNDPPAHRIASPHLSRLPVSGHVVNSSYFGRTEVRQYGRLHNRDVDVAVIMVMPRKGIGMGTQFAQDLRELNLLRGTRPFMTTTHYDLETRFGEFRATEMRVDTDGRWKQCLAFRSRLDTAAVYLTGWYCDASGNKPGAEMLACMLDRLVIDTELASKEADRFMRTHMAKPQFCSSESVSQTTDTGARRRPTPPSRWSQPSQTYRQY